MSNKTKFENENVSVSLQRLPQCKVVLDIKLSPQAVAASRAKALRNINKEVSVPGFRKGKAPIPYIEKNFPQVIEKEWKNVLKTTSLAEALNLVQLLPYGDTIQEFSIKNYSLTEGAQISVEYETAPEIPVIEPKNLVRPNIPKQSLTEEVIAEALYNLRYKDTTWKKVERPAQEGDFVVADLDYLSNPPAPIYSNYRFHLVKDKMPAWLYNLMLGAVAGEPIEQEVSLEKTQGSEPCQECEEGTQHTHTTKALVRFIPHEVQEGEPLPLDDELAKKFGLENLEKLREGVILSLEKDLEDSHLDSMRSSMQQQLLDKYPFELPESMIQKTVQNFTEDLTKDLRSQNVDPSLMKKQLESAKPIAREKFTRQFRIYYLCRLFSEVNDQEVTEKEVIEEILHQHLLSKLGRSHLNFSKGVEELKSEVRYYLQVIKVIDFLIEHTKQ